MAFEKQSIPTVPVRLAFHASEALNESLLLFVKPEVQAAMKAQKKRFPFVSVQVAHMGLYARAPIDKDVIAHRKYENQVWSVHNTSINLLPKVDVDDSQRNVIYIRTALFLTANKELRVLVQPPLFPRAEGGVDIYTRIPREIAASSIQREYAERELHARMGERMGEVAMAPWLMSVSGAQLLTQWDQPPKPSVSVT